MKTYSTYQTDIPRIINNSDPDTLLWATEVINDSIRYLVTRYYFNERTYTVPGGTVAQTQFYNLPPQVKKLINVTVTIGSVLWQPKECPSRQYWDSLNVITFYQDFPSYFFIYNGQLGIWPIPASAGNTLTMNYKTRIPDLVQGDYTTGTITLSSGTSAIVGSATTFAPWMAGNYFTSSYAQGGDQQWYQIGTYNSTTSLTLDNNYTGPSLSGANYTIGQVPILPEDYQDLPLYRMANIYYTTRLPDPARAQLYQGLWDKGLAALNEEFGSKTSNVILTDTDAMIVNPNLFTRHL